jgi:hypothetical protein
MRALAKLVSINNPDKILFVGEALVGNEAVDQLSKFDRALRDFSGVGGVSKGRGIDGMLVTKWDTVDDKVSPLLRSIHYADADIRSLAVVGWRSLIYDIRDRAANRLCWDRTGMRPIFRFPSQVEPNECYRHIRT